MSHHAFVKIDSQQQGLTQPSYITEGRGQATQIHVFKFTYMKLFLTSSPA